MKRTLLEVFGGLTAVVVMGSFHHQLARLEAQQQHMATLEHQVADAVARASSPQDVEALR